MFRALLHESGLIDKHSTQSKLMSKFGYQIGMELTALPMAIEFMKLQQQIEVR
jgi:hypothetical protein